MKHTLLCTLAALVLTTATPIPATPDYPTSPNLGDTIATNPGIPIDVAPVGRDVSPDLGVREASPNELINAILELKAKEVAADGATEDRFGKRTDSYIANELAKLQAEYNAALEQMQAAKARYETALAVVGDKYRDADGAGAWGQIGKRSDSYIANELAKLHAEYNAALEKMQAAKARYETALAVVGEKYADADGAWGQIGKRESYAAHA